MDNTRVDCLINGIAGDTISVSDRGLLYGDGAFETLAVHGQRIPLWPAHMQRLQAVGQRLGIAVPTADLLLDEINRVVDREAATQLVKIIVTRGSGPRGYRPLSNGTPTRIICAYPWSRHYNYYQQHGISIRQCETRLGHHCLAGLKHLNRLEQVLAQAEWQAEEDIQEGIMLDCDANVIEGTMSNIFVVKNDQLITPDLHQAGVAGVMRACLLDIARRNAVDVRVSTLSLDDIVTADEVFFCNSVIGIWPVKKFMSHQWQVPGRLSARLMSLLNDHLLTSGIRLPW